MAIKRVKPEEENDSPCKVYKVLCQKVRLDILQKVDKAVSERAGMNRNAWIQEAIQEKIKRIENVH